MMLTSIAIWVPNLLGYLISSTRSGTYRYQTDLGTKYLISRYPIPSTRYGTYGYQTNLDTKYLILRYPIPSAKSAGLVPMGARTI